MPDMEVTPYGDSAVLINCDPTEVLAVADSLRNAGEVVLGMASVAVLGQPGISLIAPKPAAHRRPSARRTRSIEVRYDGVDLAAVAKSAALTVDEVIERHSAAEYEVAMLGFAAGFPYLRGLDPRLRLPRRATPRTSVPAGSVAIAGEWTGIYPVEAPGGWHLLGTTDQALFDPTAREDPAFLGLGDLVRFVPVLGVGPWPRSTRSREHRRDRRDVGSVEVVRAGLTLIEDLGRAGFARFGVSCSGAADPVALRLANRLVGNADGAAALECNLEGPTLRIHERRTVAVVGADCGLPTGRAIEVGAGEEIAVGMLHGCMRSYLAIEGGIVEPFTLGSCSTDTLSGLGPSRVAAGDRLRLGGTTLGRGVLRTPRLRSSTVRVMIGPHGEAAHGTRADPGPLAGWFEVTASSDRIGVRLRRVVTSPSGGGAAAELTSLPMVTGAVQLPPDGQPIVLLADHGTTGGYPVVAVVISADLPIAAQARPGDRLRFETVTRDEALAAWADHERWLRTAVARLDRIG